MKKPSNYAIFIGILFIAIGFVFLIKPEFALRTMIIIAGILALIKGVSDLFMYFRLKKGGRKADFSLLLSGIFILLLGILLLFNNYFGSVFIGVLFAIWFAFEALATLFSLRFFTVKKGFGFWFLLILSLVSLALSVLLLIRPIYSALSFTLIVGLFFLFQGIVLSVIAVKFKAWFSEK
ncbi:DUF308 domain-containing protein [Kurthia sibirica]|uniref:HdeD family acid-resistance protein n=1 Tax=Kurthia sibirica TaxID=202750 RepID=A0A2U3ALK6_9BACL|nr:DUF308 domain-containing protein [Kurthia sibirica]PWI25389.1 hypothetical protein DEX24_08610 [Kurthia sibirica]GEK34593.1 membrane protein [Kurthia sibirica]